MEVILQSSEVTHPEIHTIEMGHHLINIRIPITEDHPANLHRETREAMTTAMEVLHPNTTIDRHILRITVDLRLNMNNMKETRVTLLTVRNINLRHFHHLRTRTPAK